LGEPTHRAGKHRNPSPCWWLDDHPLRLIAIRRNNTDIATPLRLSQKAVRNHVSNIFAMLQVADRGQAIVQPRGGLGR
jgi:hypothetical protein